MTAAVMNVKTHEIRKVIQYARLPPAAMPVEKVTLTPPMKYRAAVQTVRIQFLEISVFRGAYQRWSRSYETGCRCDGGPRG